jgi:hypothetical protein
MALGGGNFVFENKILDGSYINFVSGRNASPSLSDRGVATVPLALTWGPLGEPFELTAGDLQRDSLALVGYEFTDWDLCPLRELFRKARLCYVYRMGSGGAKASGALGTAKYVGTFGNKLRVVVWPPADDGDQYEVRVVYVNPKGEEINVATQRVASGSELKDDAFVVYNKTVGLSTLNFDIGSYIDQFTGGVDPTVSNADYSAYLAKMEPYSFNAMCCPSYDSVIIGQFAAFTKRMRDEQGVKFQCVVHAVKSALSGGEPTGVPDLVSAFEAPDHEGVVAVRNVVTNDNAPYNALVFWVAGIIAGTEVNKNAGNKVYDGEYSIDVNFTQRELERLITGGMFAFHRVGNDIRVLSDINSLVNVTQEKGEDFKNNQTIRVLDQIGNDIAVLFNTKYLNAIQNDAAGRVSFWSDVVTHHEQLQKVRAIENFVPDDITVEQGNNKKAVRVTDRITVVNAMSQLYMTVIVS